MNCLCCGNADISSSVQRAALPVFQNVVFDSTEEALRAPTGALLLATCNRCGFSFNGAFRADLVQYDERYDNTVESQVFHQYYRDLAAELVKRVPLHEGIVFEVGCGQGAFLRHILDAAPDIRGVGIDPACTPRNEGRLELIQDTFRRELFQGRGSLELVLLRHVLEHVESPVAFLEELRNATDGALLYVEVPDFNWIIDNGAFWDFCYEHCNYFTPASLSTVASLAGYEIVDSGSSFGWQYQWILCRGAKGKNEPRYSDPRHQLERIVRYQTQEKALLERIARQAELERGLVLWGMATKGVILSTLLPRGAIAAGVDMNEKKQGRFCPQSATPIYSPDWLLGQPNGKSVLVMNPNYLEEIREIGRTRFPQLRFIDVHDVGR